MGNKVQGIAFVDVLCIPVTKTGDRRFRPLVTGGASIVAF